MVVDQFISNVLVSNKKITPTEGCLRKDGEKGFVRDLL